MADCLTRQGYMPPFRLTLPGLVIALTFLLASSAQSQPDSIFTGWTMEAARPSDWHIVQGTASLSHRPAGIHIEIPAETNLILELRTEPVWVYRFPELRITSTQEHLTTSVALFHNDSVSPSQPARWLPIAPLSPTDGTIRFTFPELPSRQVNRMRFVMQSGPRKASFQLTSMEFWSAVLPSLSIPFEASGQPALPDLKPLPFSGGTTPLPASIESNLTLEGIPFLLPDKMIASDHGRRGAITVPAFRSAREVFLLMGVHLSGTDAAFSFMERQAINHPGQVIVQLQYSDGSVDESFPRRLSSGEYSIQADALHVYSVPVRSHLPLRSIRIVETMSYGHIVLAGVTLNIGSESLQSPESQPPQRLLSGPPNVTSSTEVRVTPGENAFVLANDSWVMQWKTSAGLSLESLQHRSNETNLLASPSPIFATIVNGLPVTNDSWTVTRVETHAGTLGLSLENTSPGIRLTANVTIQPATDDQCVLSLRITNNGSTETSLRILFPALQSIRMSEQPEQDFYFYPRKRVIWDSAPTDRITFHSGHFPFQFMTAYSVSGQAGITVQTRDRNHWRKHFRLRKSDRGINMGVEYGHTTPVRIPAGETIHLPTTVLQVHEGDWYSGFRSYRTWVDSWPSKSRLDSLPGYSLTSGESLTTEDIRSASKPIRGIGIVHTNQAASFPENVTGPSTAISLDGYRMEIDAASALPAAARLLDASGTPKRWPGSELAMMSPGSPDWQANRIQVAEQHIAESTPELFYLDHIGFADESLAGYHLIEGRPEPGNPVAAEASLLSSLRSSFSQALLTEEIPTDATIPTMDGAYSYSKLGDRDYNSPAHLNLFRFAFPQHALFERIDAGVFPSAISPRNARLAFFHGSGMVLQHPLHAHYSRETLEFLQMANETWQRYPDAFRSSDVEPLVPTELTSVYANRFRADTYDLYTIMNTGHHTQRGRLFSLATPRDSVVNVWETEGFSLASSGEQTTEVFIQLHPDQIACLWVQK